MEECLLQASLSSFDITVTCCTLQLVCTDVTDDVMTSFTVCHFVLYHFWLSAAALLWPARATTKMSLGSSCRMGVPERGGDNKMVYCLNQLTTAPSLIGRKHQNVLQGTLYYQK